MQCIILNSSGTFLANKNGIIYQCPPGCESILAITTITSNQPMHVHSVLTRFRPALQDKLRLIIWVLRNPAIKKTFKSVFGESHINFKINILELDLYSINKNTFYLIFACSLHHFFFKQNAFITAQYLESINTILDTHLRYSRLSPYNHSI